METGTPSNEDIMAMFDSIEEVLVQEVAAKPARAFQMPDNARRKEVDPPPPGGSAGGRVRGSTADVLARFDFGGEP